MLICTTAAEWCVTAWGATFVAHAAAVSTDTAGARSAAAWRAGTIRRDCSHSRSP
jgi:hypothetical protein